MTRLRREWEDFWVPFSSDPMIRTAATYAWVLIVLWLVLAVIAQMGQPLCPADQHAEWFRIGTDVDYFCAEGGER